VNFVAGNLNKLPKKTGFGRKNQLSTQCVHICFFLNVFTLGPMAQATLVFMNIHFIEEEGSYTCAHRRSEKV
jgi:hypothetical protein